MKKNKMAKLNVAAYRARSNTLKIVSASKAAHVGSSLSAIEIFIATLGIAMPDDCIIVSKGHAAAGYYASLEALGHMPLEDLLTYGKNGSVLFGHVSKESGFGIEFSSGSLGHGLPYGVGRALGAMKNMTSRRVFVICSDGEMDEGTTWESALLGAHHNLSNLTLVIDRNRLQSIKGTEETLQLEPLGDKWRAFNWAVSEIDGHDLEALNRELLAGTDSQPHVIIANTVKGKGVSFMENNNLWHYVPPNQEQLASGLQELDNEH